MSIDVKYTAIASAVGGREGNAKSDDGRFEAKLSTPRELGGAGGPGTNPEQMFAAGYAACFLSAIRYVAAGRKLRITDEARVSADVGIGSREDGRGFGLEIALEISLPDIDPATAAELVEEAHVVCPYSHLARNGVDVRLSMAA